MWPASWNSRSFSSTTVWPRWMSGVVGSIPSFTRSGRPRGQLLRASLPARQHVDRVARQSPPSGPMLDCRLRSAGRASCRGREPLSMAALGLKPRRRGGSKLAAQRRRPRREAQRKPRLKKLRILFVLLGLGVLALVSMVFGMMAAVSQDLPAIDNFAQYKASKNSEVFDARRRTDRHPDQQPEPDPAHLRARSPRTSRTRWSRSRTRASTNTAASTSRASAAPWSRTCSARAPHAGRLDDHRAVRQERARSPGQPDDLREVPRGGARLPARAPLDQGQDPHRVPEHDLLRRGRLRDRGGRPHLLRQPPTPAAASRARALRLGARALGGGDAGRDHRLAVGLRPQDLTRKRPSPAATWCWKR